MAIVTKKDGRVYVTWRESGKPQWRYFKKERAAAEDFQAQLQEEGKIRPYRRTKLQSPTLDELAQAFLDARANELSARQYQKTYANIVNIILPIIGHKDALRLKFADLDAYVKVRSKRCKNISIRRDLAVIKSILNWSVGRSLIHRNPVAGYKGPPDDSERIQPPTMVEIERIYTVAQPHLQRIILLAYYLGARPGPSELFKLDWEHVDFESKTVFVESARKGGIDARPVPIHPALMPHLRRWYVADGQKGPLIHYNGRPMTSRCHTSWVQAKKRAGITRRIRLYDLRHAMASHALAQGGNLKAVSKILGHSNTSITARVYQHVDFDMLKDAVGGMPSLKIDQTF